ncbi:HD domain-containing protein [bacterium]|nr:HD domain-containing protein [bacterium]
MAKVHKILNDPVYGFITLPSQTLFDLVEHPYFQRLRRIAQLGLSWLVYPGAYHTRFHHALGAMHLMMRAVEVLRRKGHSISEEEEEAVCIGILLHDIGHGPFSHALEHSIVPTDHEQLSAHFMRDLDRQFSGKLGLAIEIFEGRYPRRFLHQLISSQLDMDRLDYLRRDSFYTGVSEGQINSERLLTMLNVHDDELVVDSKGIYSVEKFIIARRLMYWQVYLHKTVLSAEFLLMMILNRAKNVAVKGGKLFGSTALLRFLTAPEGSVDFERDPSWLQQFARLDDYDVLGAIKEWCLHEDVMLSDLSHRLIDRNLLGIELHNEPIPPEYEQKILQATRAFFQFQAGEEAFLVRVDSISNSAYDASKNRIALLYKDGTTVDWASAADQLNLSALSNTVARHFICYPKEIRPLLKP